MINSLTVEQTNHLSTIAKTWIQRGLNTDQISIKKAYELAHLWNKEIMGKSTPVIYLSSPLGCWMAVNLFSGSQVESQVESQVLSQVSSQVRSQVGLQVGLQVLSQVWSQVGSQVESQVWSQVGSQVLSQVNLQVSSQVRSQVGSQVLSQVNLQVSSQVRSQVGSQVLSQVSSQVRSQVGSQVRSQVRSWAEKFMWPYFSGHFWAGYFAWVDALKYIGVTDLPLRKYHILEKCHELGVFYPLDNVLIVGSKPSVLTLNSVGQLHNDQSAAIEYADGYKLFFLNGIAMDPEQVLTSSENMSPESVLMESNVDKRRELIRKIGIERMLSKLPNRSLDKRDNYELLSVTLSEEVKDARYLRMINPSIGIWHLEGVDPSCKTIEESLNWRNSNWHENAEILT